MNRFQQGEQLNNYQEINTYKVRDLQVKIEENI